jgi:hypothetical protein
MSVTLAILSLIAFVEPSDVIQSFPYTRHIPLPVHVQNVQHAYLKPLSIWFKDLIVVFVILWISGVRRVHGRTVRWTVLA